MNVKRLFVVAMTLVLLAAAAVTLAASPVQADVPDEDIQVSGELNSTLGGGFTYQGRLTDGSGRAVPDGNYTLTFYLYKASSGGTALDSDVDSSVAVKGGLFSTEADLITEHFNGQQLWISVKVGGGSELPRQAIRAVPYALSLRPGALISDTTAAPVFTVENYGAADGDAIMGRSYGDGEGVTGYSVGGNGVAGQTGDADTAAVYGLNTGAGAGVRGSSSTGPALDLLGTGRIQSTATSYVFIGGNGMVKNLSADSTRWDMAANGSALVYRGGTAGSKTVYLPVVLPAVLYGQNVTIEQVTVYYRCQNGTNNYISRTVVNKQTDADSYANLIDDATNRTSTTSSSYTLNLTVAARELSASQGALGIFLDISFANDTEWVQIGGVRLALSHD